MPCFYTYAKRLSVEAAARAAGFDEVSTISNASAAAIAYSQKTKLGESSVIALSVDIGAASLSLCLFTVSKGMAQVLSRTSVPDALCCGRNVTEIIRQYLQNKYPDVEPSQITTELAESMKRTLSSGRTCKNTLSHDMILELSRDELHESMEPTAKELRERITMTLYGAGLSRFSDVQEVVLVGSGSRVPFFGEVLTDWFGPGPMKFASTQNAENAVSIGAAYFAAKFFLPRSICINFYDIVIEDVSLVVRRKQTVLLWRRNQPTPTRTNDVSVLFDDFLSQVEHEYNDIVIREGCGSGAIDLVTIPILFPQVRHEKSTKIMTKRSCSAVVETSTLQS